MFVKKQVDFNKKCLYGDIRNKLGGGGGGRGFKLIDNVK